MATLVPLDSIDQNPFQTRSVYDQDAIAELAVDVDLRGLLQPPVGRLVDGTGRVLDPAAYVQPGSLVSVFVDSQAQRVQLAFGHRRLRAYRLLADGAGGERYASLPVELRVLTDQDMALSAWSENAQRKDVSPIEEATAIQRMMSTFGWTQEQVGQRLNLNRSTVANKLRLLGAPEPVRQALALGQLSERQAQALMPLAEVPQAILERAEATPDYNKSRRPSEIIKQAANLSSDQIRERVQSMIVENTVPLGNANDCPVHFPVEGAGGVRSARCDACPDRVRRGQELRCPDKSCMERKTLAWTLQVLAEASQKTGNQIGRTEGYTLSMVETFDNASAKSHLPAIMTRGCPNLRLVFGGWMGVALPDHPLVRVVCFHGKDGVCKCLDEAIGRDREAEEKALEATKRQIKDQLLAPAKQAIADALLAGSAPSGLWQIIYGKVRNYGAPNLPETASARRVVNALAEGLVSSAIHYGNDKDLATAREDLDNFLDQIGLAKPWQTPTEEIILRKLARIQEWYKNCALKVPSLEAVRGNMDNIRHLMDDLEAAGVTGEAYSDVSARLHATLNLLGQLLLLVQEKPAEETGGNLLDLLAWYASDIPPAATPWELSYALEFAWTVERERREKRVEMIQARLVELTKAKEPSYA